MSTFGLLPLATVTGKEVPFEAATVRASRACRSSCVRVLERVGRKGAGDPAREVRNYHSVRTDYSVTSMSSVARAYRAGCTEQGDQTSLDNVLVDANAPHLGLAAGGRALDICGGLDISTRTRGAFLADRVFLVIDDVEINTET